MTADRSSSVVPKRRFPEFRDAPEWRTPYGDTLFDSVNNRSAAPGLPVLAITQEHGAIPRDQIDYHVSVTAESVASYKEVCEGDFIISLRSFQGGIEHSRYHGICSPAYVILRRKGGGNDHFFRHLFKSERFIQQLTRNIEGIRDGKMISYAQFSEQLLPVPEPPEQQKIADCLGSLDDLTAAEIRKLEALRQHKQGLMQQLFPQPGETVPRLRFPEFQNAGEWEERLVGDVFKVARGKVLAMPLVRDSRSNETPFPVYSSQTKNRGLAGYYSEYLYEDAITWTTDGANAGDVNYRTGKFYCTNVCGVLINNDGQANLCTAELINSVSRQHVSFVGNPKLMNGVMSKIAVPFPKPAEQQCIAPSLSSLEDVLAAQARKIDALKQKKQGLLQQLFPSLETE